MVRRVPGVQAFYRELRTQLALRRRVVALDHPRADVRIRVATRSIARLRVRPSEKEPWTVRWIEEHIRPGDVLWDVGANVGSYALLAAKLEPGARVVAVEPGPANYAALCENILLNGLGRAIVPVPVALAESNHVVSFTVSDAEAGAAEHTLTASVNSQFVIAHALDDLVDVFGLPAPTLLKIDVDGAEPAVIAGARKTLAGAGLRSAIVEVETANEEQVDEAFDAVGMALVERVSVRDGVPLPGVSYAIYAPRNGG